MEPALRINPDALSAWIAERGLRKSELAVAAQISPQYLSDLLAGRKPGSGAVIRRIADALRVNVRVLVCNPNEVAA